MKSIGKKTVPVFYISEERQDGYYHIHADVMLQETDENGKTRYTNRHHHEYEDLQVSCQGNDEARTVSSSAETSQCLYGWELRYVGYRPNFTEIEAAYKAMKRIETSLTKMTETEGYAREFGEYVLRVAKAAKIDHAIVKNTNEHYRGYADSDFRTLSLGDMRNHINHLQFNWLQSLRERYQQAA